ncbi:MAG: serine hydrolase [Kordiimonadaceae bacterium]|nr:serine hydrolase [Kordiimonadaceae bacterium]
MIKLVSGICLLVGLSAAAHAQIAKTPATMQAYAAGYKAAFTCSATFNAGKTVEQITAHEFNGIYPTFRPYFDKVSAAVIDRENKRVSVQYTEEMPPRIAQWRPGLGCAQLPVGASEADAQYLPSIAVKRPPSSDEQPWQAMNSGGTKLQALLDTIMHSSEYGKDTYTSALLVASSDALLAERYTEGLSHKTSQRTWSVAKSITATLIGTAVQGGLLDVNKPTAIADWQSPMDPRKAITLENLLHMASGLDTNIVGSRTDRLYMGGGRVSDTATERALEAKPGTRWKYANYDTLLVGKVLRTAFKNQKAFNEYPLRALFNKLGMNDTYLETDWSGDFVLSSQAWTTSRDLARLGILYLQDGVWKGERLLPKGWTNYVSAAKGPQPPVKVGDIPIPGYGAQFWLYSQDRFPYLPDDTIAARGHRGQYLVIIPSKNIVMVRRGYDPAGGDGFKLEKYIADVLEALS